MAGYTTANDALLHQNDFPDKVDLEDVVLTMQNFKNDRRWAVTEETDAETKDFFTPEKCPQCDGRLGCSDQECQQCKGKYAVSYWIDPEATMVWFLKHGPEGPELLYTRLTKIVQRLCNRAEPGPAQRAMCQGFARFGGWKPESRIITSKDGFSFVLAAKFTHPAHGNKVMLQCLQLPHNILAAFGTPPV